MATVASDGTCGARHGRQERSSARADDEGAVALVTLLVPLLAIAAMVALNALYVAAEFATVGARRSRVQDAAASGSGPAGRLLGIMVDSRRLDTYVAACQIGITLSSLVAGAYGQAQLTPLLEPLFGGVGGRGVAVVVVLVAITGVQVVLGELLPKTVALRHPERLALATLLPMQVSLWLFRPLVALFNGSAFRLLRLRNVDVERGHAHVHSPEELARLYRASAAGGLIDAAERDMLAGILNVEERLVREVMTPRTRLVTVAATAPVGESLARLAGGPHTRFPVTDGDDVIGVVHLRDLYVRARSEPASVVGAVTEPVVAVGEVLTVPTLWRTLRDQSTHCALVVNEYGDVAGFVTLEDAIEEIFGEVQDEFDLEDEPVTFAGGRVSIRGDVLLSQLSERFDLQLEVDGVDTLGGLVWHRLGRPPRVGDVVPMAEGGPALRVDAMDRRRVTRASFDLPDVDRPAGHGRSPDQDR